MSEQTLMILLMGGVVVAFAFFGTYMAKKQKDDEKAALYREQLLGLKPVQYIVPMSDSDLR